MNKSRTNSKEIEEQIKNSQKFVIKLLLKKPRSPNYIRKELKEKGVITSPWLLDKSKIREKILKYLEISEQAFKLKYSKPNKELLKELFDIDWDTGKDEAHYDYYYISEKHAKKSPILLKAYENRSKAPVIRAGIRDKEGNWHPQEKVWEILKERKEEEREKERLWEEFKKSKRSTSS